MRGARRGKYSDYCLAEHLLLVLLDFVTTTGQEPKTDILGYSDTLGTSEKCHCEKICAYSDTFFNMGFTKSVSVGGGATVIGVTVTKYGCSHKII